MPKKETKNARSSADRTKIARKPPNGPQKRSVNDPSGKKTLRSPPPDRALPPVLFPGISSTERRQLAELKAAGRIRSAGPRLYVSVSESETAATIRRSWSAIVARLFPHALITHRTALEFIPSPTGDVFITGRAKREVRYPGLTLKFLQGPGPLPDDPPFLNIRSSSLPRALLENLSARGTTHARVLPPEQLEARLESILHAGGESELDGIRDRAREIAQELGWGSQFKRLDKLIGALLGTRRARVSSDIARARVAGEPFDAECLERLQLLFAQLRNPLPTIDDSHDNSAHFRNKAFFESYFSNYIEGTTFEVAEAEAIVFEKIIPPGRPKDAHDILGTFEIASDLGEMSRTPRTFEEFIAVLAGRHKQMMSRRPEVAPGSFKTETNRAGGTVFVHPEYVRGTLLKGWELSRGLEVGLPRSLFVAFLLSDVHPFVDGNGRISRLMMNSELVSVGQSTIIIPTVFRDDYLHSLRALSRRNRPGPFVEALVRASKFSHLEFSKYPAILADITRRNWFREPDEARIVDQARGKFLTDR